MARTVRIAAKPKMVSQPRKVISELLSPQQRVEVLDADHQRGDQAEHLGAAHIRLIPDTRPSSTANMSTAINMAMTSMDRSWLAWDQGTVRKPARRIQIL